MLSKSFTFEMSILERRSCKHDESAMFDECNIKHASKQDLYQQALHPHTFDHKTSLGVAASG